MVITNHPHSQNKMVVAGPCAAETREQILASLQEAARRNVDYVRVSLWKPRTKPGFDGLKEAGIPLLAEAAQMGLNPATEVLMPEQAQTILDQVLPVLGNQKLMLWIGARNQNHQVQHDVAKIVAQDSRVHLMVKNQPWPCEKHWEGIAEHVLSSGINKENVALCHRGFIPSGENPKQWRNVTNSAMAMRIREKTGLKMLLDLSHTAGHSDKIIDAALEAVVYPYDGTVTEVHPDPTNAWTDAGQQITWDVFDEILERMNQEQTRLQASITSIVAPVREKVLQA